jgi:hypothetical protein
VFFEQIGPAQRAGAVNRPVQIAPSAIDFDVRVSRPKGFHPRPLTEPDVNLSAHPAPITRPQRHIQATNV